VNQRWVYSFSDTLPAGAEARALLGGKGASLAEMTRAGWHVPPGFTITTAACRWFYEHDGQWPPELEAEVRAHLARLEADTGRALGRGADRLLVSVRSGAAVSMPGMMDTVLNVGSNEQPWEELVQCINAVFRSWMSERAVAYRARHRITGLPGTAVNVQAMFPSAVSGVLFTRNPNDPDDGQMVVEAAHGLGEVVVSGEVTPDRFLVARDDLSRVQALRSDAHALPRPGRTDVSPVPNNPNRSDSAAAQEVDRAPSTDPGRGILPDRRDGCPTGPRETSIAPEQSTVERGIPTRSEAPAPPTLDAAQLKELCSLALRLEQHFGRPQDIEWGWAQGRFALLQCRPIRGLELAREAAALRQAEIARLKTLAGGQRRVWVAHNLGETLPHPTPLTWDIVSQFMSGAGGFGRMYADFGYRPAREICERGFLELIAGRIYADPERAARLFWDGLPLGYDPEVLRRDPNALNQAPTRFDPERMDSLFLLRVPSLIGGMRRAARTIKQERTSAARHFEQEILPPYLDYVRSRRGLDLSRLTTNELLGELRARRERVLDQFGKESLKPGFLGALALGELEKLLIQLLGPTESAFLTATLTSALEGDTTRDQDERLAAVARGETPLGEFLEAFGHRCAGEMELMSPRWREAPAALDGALDQLRRQENGSPGKSHRAAEVRFRQAIQQLPQTLAQAGGSALREEIEEHLRVARQLLPYRESGKHYLMMGYELIRLVLVELGRRWNLGDGVFFLREAELHEFEARRGEIEPLLASRRLRWEAAQRLPLPDLIDSKDLDSLGSAPKPQPSDRHTLAGVALSAGLADGVVRIVLDPAEAGDLGADYVLVCPSTDPGWTPLFLRARALVVERGGLLSHGAIVARDFGLPAVGCPDATRLLQDGERVQVDGHAGTITRLRPGHGRQARQAGARLARLDRPG
jgi:rifampicin phosphotransferase